jgi:cystathionine beta-lyase
MPHNFDVVTDRRQSDSAKWNRLGYDPLPPDVLPLWVADMDFRAPDSVIAALHQRVEEGIFGYAIDGPPGLRPAIQQWYASHFGWRFPEEHIMFLPNLVSALFATARAFTAPGDSILTLLPIYPPFLWAIKGSEREINRVDLVEQETGGVLRYEIDFDAMEKAITPRTKLLMLSNPHNPVGRVYTRTELERLAELCLRHDLMICSDEIHADLLMDGAHLPLASLSPEVAARTLTLNAPSKTFNIPGMGLGYAIGTPDLLQRFRTVRDWIIPHPNVLGYYSALAAYTDTSGWLADLLVYLRGNRDYLVNFVRGSLPGLRVTCPEGTYLAWLDCRALGLNVKASQFFLDQARVGLNDGGDFGEGYEGYVRLNFGCPRSILVEALNRMKTAIDALAQPI